MYPTAEVRWFLEGPAPESVETWFRAVAGLQVWEVRTDRYVRPSAENGLGVKGRTGNLEVKRLAEALGDEAFHDAVVGRVERWRKWSFPLDASATLQNGGGDWVAVGKRRQKASFAVRGEDVEPMRREVGTEPGCSLEVAHVSVDGKPWWSLSLEAFGAPEAALPAVLRHAARHVFGSAEPPALDAAQSMSYPAWLWRTREGER